MDFESIINGTRASLDQARSTYSDDQFSNDRIRKPLSYYLTLDFRFNRQLRSQRPLIERGRVVWGAIVQANSVLFEPRGSSACLPADAMYCDDESLDAHPGSLVSYAHELFELKGEATTPEMQKFSRKLANETSGDVKLTIPTGFTEGHPCYLATILIARKHLPGNHLADGLFPMLILPEETKASMILPRDYWDDRLKEFWLE